MKVCMRNIEQAIPRTRIIAVRTGDSVDVETDLKFYENKSSHSLRRWRGAWDMHFLDFLRRSLSFFTDNLHVGTKGLANPGDRTCRRTCPCHVFSIFFLMAIYIFRSRESVTA